MIDHFDNNVIDCVNLCEIGLLTQFGTHARFFLFDFLILSSVYCQFKQAAAAVVCKDFFSKLVAINRTRCRNSQPDIRFAIH